MTFALLCTILFVSKQTYKGIDLTEVGVTWCCWWCITTGTLQDPTVSLYIKILVAM